MHKLARFRLLPTLLGLGAALLICHIPAQAADADTIAALGKTAKDDGFLRAEDAFKVGATAVAPDRIEVVFQVNPCCYLYRERMKFALPAGLPAALGPPDLPKGDHKVDDQGEHEVYHHDIVVRLPVVRGSKAAFTLPLEVSYQGCAEAGLCYAPTTTTFNVKMPEASSVSAVSGGKSAVGGYVSEQDRLAGLIRDGNIS